MRKAAAERISEEAMLGSLPASPSWKSAKSMIEAKPARIREGGPDGLPGVRALGLQLAGSGLVQVSTNIEDHRAVTAAAVLTAVAARAPVRAAELVAPAPEAALAGWPEDVELRMPGAIEALLGR